MHIKFGQAGFGSSLITALCKKKKKKKTHTMVPEEADHQPYMFVLSVEHDLLVAAISIARRKTCIFISRVNVLNAIHIKWHSKEKNICLPTF